MFKSNYLLEIHESQDLTKDFSRTARSWKGNKTIRKKIYNISYMHTIWIMYNIIFFFYFIQIWHFLFQKVYNMVTIVSTHKIYWTILILSQNLERKVEECFPQQNQLECTIHLTISYLDSRNLWSCRICPNSSSTICAASGLPSREFGMIWPRIANWSTQSSNTAEMCTASRLDNMVKWHNLNDVHA